MQLVKRIVKSIFNKRYGKPELIETGFVYACEGRIIRCLEDNGKKKPYCAAYVLKGIPDSN